MVNQFEEVCRLAGAKTYLPEDEEIPPEEKMRKVAGNAFASALAGDKKAMTFLRRVAAYCGQLAEHNLQGDFIYADLVSHFYSKLKEHVSYDTESFSKRLEAERVFARIVKKHGSIEQVRQAIDFCFAKGSWWADKCKGVPYFERNFSKIVEQMPTPRPVELHYMLDDGSIIPAKLYAKYMGEIIRKMER